MMVGSWRMPKTDGTTRGYIEFNADGTGVLGVTELIDESERLNPFLTQIIVNWKVQHDTLHVQLELTPGLAFFGPDGKEIKSKNEPKITRFYIESLTDSTLVLHDFEGIEFLGSTLRYERGERMR